jgi:hypothetical protein
VTERRWCGGGDGGNLGVSLRVVGWSTIHANENMKRSRKGGGNVWQGRGSEETANG